MTFLALACDAAAGAGSGVHGQRETIGVAKVGALQAARCCVSSCGSRRAKRSRRGARVAAADHDSVPSPSVSDPAAARGQRTRCTSHAAAARTARAPRCRARPLRRRARPGRRTAAGPAARRRPWRGNRRPCSDSRRSLPQRANGLVLDDVHFEHVGPALAHFGALDPRQLRHGAPARRSRSHREEAALRVRQHALRAPARRRPLELAGHAQLAQRPALGRRSSR